MSEKRSFPLNQWYVIALGKEVDRTLRREMFLGNPVVLYRRNDGEPVALQDACAHRFMPLSAGRLIDDEISCGYHGWRYCSTGKCTHIPSQDEIPRRAEVRSYPLVEKGPFIWAWGGEASLADPSTVPSIPSLEDPTWVSGAFSMDIKANYILMHDNLMDLTHFHHLHTGKLGNEDWDNGTIDVEVKGNQVIRTHTLLNSEPQGYMSFLGVPKDCRIDNTNVGVFAQPGVSLTTVYIHALDRDMPDVEQTVNHILTPQTETSTKYFVAIATDYKDCDMETYCKAVAKVFEEDKFASEAVQENISLYGNHLPPENSVKGDKAGLQLRHMIKKIIEHENAEMANTAK